MATILLVEDALDVGAYEARALEAAGHRVVTCRGSPTPFSRCPMIAHGSCQLPEGVDLLIFSCGLYAPVDGGSSRGADLLRAYRAHPRYGALPCLVVALGPADVSAGSGPVEVVPKFSPPTMVLAAAERLLLAGEKGVAVVG